MRTIQVTKRGIGLALTGTLALGAALTAGAAYATLDTDARPEVVGGVIDDADVPKLLPATTDDGQRGFINREELEKAGMASTPEEAVRMQAQREKEGTLRVPIYEADGRTLVGYRTFESSNQSIDERPVD